jgi:hypothetical protein
MGAILFKRFLRCRVLQLLKTAGCFDWRAKIAKQLGDNPPFKNKTESLFVTVAMSCPCCAGHQPQPAPTAPLEIPRPAVWFQVSTALRFHLALPPPPPTAQQNCHPPIALPSLSPRPWSRRRRSAAAARAPERYRPPFHLNLIAAHPTSGIMCLKGSGLPSGLCDMHSSTAPFRSGVRKQCRLLGETAHQAFVKARRTHPARTPRFGCTSPRFCK